MIMSNNRQTCYRIPIIFDVGIDINNATPVNTVHYIRIQYIV